MSDKNQSIDQIIEEAFVKSLRVHGFLFPESDKELTSLKEKISGIKTQLPPDLVDPLGIVSRGKITKLESFELSQDSEVERNLAWAAREGKEISEDIRKKMLKDKQSAQENKNDKGD